MLSEILAKLIIRSPVFDLLENLKESLDLDRVLSWLNTSADIVILKVQVKAPLILDDHILEDDTNSHVVAKGFFVPQTSRTLDNSKASLQNTESSLNVFPQASWQVANKDYFLISA
jgi:hypothetical protein